MKFDNKTGHSFLKLRPLLEVLLVLAGGFIYGAYIVRSSAFTVAFTAGLLLFFVLARSPLKALSFLLFVVPFSQMQLLNEPVVDLPGARPFLLLGVLVVVIVMLNYSKANRMPRLLMALAGALFVFFAVSVFRAFSYKEIIGFATDQEYTDLGFFLSFLIKPLVYFIPLIIVAKFVHDEHDIDFLVKTIMLALVVLSSCFLFYYVFNVTNKSDIEAVWKTVGTELRLQKGQAASLYTICFPMVLARYFATKDRLSLLAICLCLPSVGFLYSRTAYVTVVLAFPLYLLFSRRLKFFPILVVLAIVVSFLVSETIVERATKGLDTENVEEILSGRLDKQWIPLTMEYLSDPQKLLFGQGRNAVLVSESYKIGLFPGATHPHNMYLELVVDAGLVAVIPIVILLVFVIKKTYALLRREQDSSMREYLCGALVSMICYFMGGMTRGSLFPVLENSYFCAVLAMVFVIGRRPRTPVGQEQAGLSGSHVERELSKIEQ